MHNDFYNPNGMGKGGGCCIEMSPGHDFGGLFLDAVSDSVVAMLNINWADRYQFKKLLAQAIHDDFRRFSEQYLHSQLDILAKSVTQALGLDENLKTDYNHATHAKFATILEAFKRNEAELPKTAPNHDGDSRQQGITEDSWIGAIAKELFPETEAGAIICLDDMLAQIKKLKEQARMLLEQNKAVKLADGTE